MCLGTLYRCTIGRVVNKFFITIASFVLFVLNIFLLVSGLILLGVGIAAKMSSRSFSYAISQLPSTITDIVDIDKLMANTAIFLIVIGSILIVFSLVGFFGSYFDIRWMLFTYWLTLLLNIIIEVSVIIYTKYSPVKLGDIAYKKMNQSFHKYKPENFYSNGTMMIPEDKHSLYWFASQAIMKCCGIKSPDDYNDLEWEREYGFGSTKFTAKVPPSCCLYSTKSTNIFKQLKLCMTNENKTSHQIGCYDAIENEIMNSSYMPEFATDFIVLIETFCVVSALYLWLKKRNEKEEDEEEEGGGDDD